MPEAEVGVNNKLFSGIRISLCHLLVLPLTTAFQMHVYTSLASYHPYLAFPFLTLLLFTVTQSVTVKWTNLSLSETLPCVKSVCFSIYFGILPPA